MFVANQEVSHHESAIDKDAYIAYIANVASSKWETESTEKANSGELMKTKSYFDTYSNVWKTTVDQ